MRYLILILSLFALAACKRAEPTMEIGGDVPPPADLVSMLTAGDSHAPTQMKHGFYGLEENQWRWVAAKFGVTLAAPPSAAAQLELKGALPESVFAKLGAVKLTASVGGKALEPETLSQAGKFTFTRDLAPGSFGPGPVEIEFTTDKALPPSAADRRELALIISSIGLK